ncbi:MAG: TonB-dependent receptor plug domain-containing protein [Aquimonas sp.]|nr:TonB-dependent receptor plug domain-containing protein [Aquimonas sp.]
MALLLAAIVAAPAAADQRSVTADPEEAEKADTMPQVTVVGRALPDPIERIERRQAKDIREIFAEEPAIDIGGGTRNGQRLYLRGIEATNLNITVDGARQGQNLYNHRGGLGNIDPDLLKRVDIQPGPAAADQGHGALGGSIRFVSVDAQDRLAPGQRFGVQGRASLTTADQTRRLSTGVAARVGAEGGLLAQVSYGEYDDLRIGDGERVPFSGGRDRMAVARYSLLQAQGHELRLGIKRNEAAGLNFMQRGDYPWQLQPIDLRARPPQRQELSRETATLDWRWRPDASWLDLGLNLYDTENDFNAPDSGGERFTSAVRGFDLRQTFSYEWGGWAGRLTTGVDGFTDRGSNRRSNREPRFNRYSNTGLFAQNRLASERGNLSFGLRHDDFETRIRNDASDNSELLINAGGLIELGAGFALFAGYGESARGAGTIPIHFAGNAVERLRFNGEFDGQLRPEFAEQSELGLRFSRNAGGGEFGVEVLGFRTRISDPIVYEQPGSGGLGNRPVTAFRNLDTPARFSGSELRLHYAGNALQAQLGLARLNTRDLPAQPQFLARFGAPSGDRAVFTLTHAFSPALNFGYTLTAVRRLDEVQAGQIVFIPKAGYSTHDLFLNWELPRLPGASLALALRNLGDRQYIRHGTFTQDGFATQEPGRDFRLSVGYRF